MLRTRLLLKLELLLAHFRAAGIRATTLHVMSGYRTPFYNQSIGNRTRYSRHLYGDAADVFVDADGDGRMDDLDGDGRVDEADARVLYALADGLGDLPSYAPSSAAWAPTVRRATVARSSTSIPEGDAPVGDASRGTRRFYNQPGPSTRGLDPDHAQARQKGGTRVAVGPARRKEKGMLRTSTRVLAIVFWGVLVSAGCSTVGTAAEGIGETAADTAEEAGEAAGTAARGVGETLSDTAETAEDELD